MADNTICRHILIYSWWLYFHWYVDSVWLAVWCSVKCHLFITSHHMEKTEAGPREI